MTILATRFDLAGQHPVMPPTGAIGVPNGTLYIPAGGWQTGYGAFQFEPGLTALARVGESGEQGDFNIVGSSDPLQICCAFAWLHQYGNYDGDLDGLLEHPLSGNYLADINTAYLRMKKRPIAVLCGMAVGILQSLLSQPLAGGPHQTRKVQLHTAEPTNGWNDGHVTMEVKRNGRWMLYDPLLHRAWKLNGEYLSLDEFAQANAIAEEHILAPLVPSFYPYRAGEQVGFHSWITYHALNHQVSIIQRLYRGAIGIWHTDGRCYFPSTPHAPPNPLYTVLPYGNWHSLLYGV
jgi:hypothetical protein